MIRASKFMRYKMHKQAYYSIITFVSYDYFIYLNKIVFEIYEIICELMSKKKKATICFYAETIKIRNNFCKMKYNIFIFIIMAVIVVME